MPLYEYKCEKGHIFEELMPSRGDVDIVLCECGEKAQRIMSRSFCKVWHYDPSRMDADAERRKCGVPSL